MEFDLAGVTSVDLTAAEQLAEVLCELQEDGHALVIRNARKQVADAIASFDSSKKLALQAASVKNLITKQN